MLNAEATKMCSKLAAALRVFLRSKADNLVQQSQGQAILYSYCSDATSFRCQTTAQSTGAVPHVLRRGKVLHELLMQRGFVMSRSSSGEEAVALLLQDPLPLTAGKSAWNMFTAASAFYPLIRNLGHQGIVIQHVCADRAAFSALDRHMRQRQKAFYTQGLGLTSARMLRC